MVAGGTARRGFEERAGNVLTPPRQALRSADIRRQETAPYSYPFTTRHDGRSPQRRGRLVLFSSELPLACVALAGSIGSLQARFTVPLDSSGDLCQSGNENQGSVPSIPWDTWDDPSPSSYSVLEQTMWLRITPASCIWTPCSEVCEMHNIQRTTYNIQRRSIWKP